MNTLAADRFVGSWCETGPMESWSSFVGGIPQRDAYGNLILSVTIPTDADGYLGRECPGCAQVFRVHGYDFEALAVDAALLCPYCGHRADADEYLTKQQWALAEQAAYNAAGQQVTSMLQKSARSLRHSCRGSGLSISIDVRRFKPVPLPGIHEEQLIRERACGACAFRYSVFSMHGFCPRCGPLPAADVATDALAAQTTKLNVIAALPSEERRPLREQGVLEGIHVETLGQTVSIVETLARTTFRARVPDADDVLKGKGNVFQRLDDLASLFRDHLALDVRDTHGLDWVSLSRLWETRHAYTHAGGRVDARFLRRVPDSRLKEGQRIVVTEADAHTALHHAGLLCSAIAQPPARSA